MEPVITSTQDEEEEVRVKMQDGIVPTAGGTNVLPEHPSAETTSLSFSQNGSDNISAPRVSQRLLDRKKVTRSMCRCASGSVCETYSVQMCAAWRERDVSGSLTRGLGLSQKSI